MTTEMDTLWYKTVFSISLCQYQTQLIGSL